MKQKKILLAGGGTFGHISPALGLKKQIESQGLKAYYACAFKDKRFPFYKQINHRISIPLTGLPRNKNPFLWIQFLFLFCLSLVISFFQFLKIWPSSVIATGGFVSYPYLFWAKSFKKPFFICEQNSYPGLVNRLYASKAKAVFLSMHDKSQKLKGNLILTGNPVRQPQVYSPLEAAQILNLLPNLVGKKFLGVVGGSQGAAKINQWILNYQNNLEDLDLHILLSVGKNNYPLVLKQKTSPNLHIFDFVEDMGAFYSLSNFLLCRAGASTIAELFYFQKPTLFIPYPFASDNHQEDNAFFATQYLPSFSLLEKELERKTLPEILKKLELAEKKEGGDKFLKAPQVIFSEVLKWI